MNRIILIGNGFDLAHGLKTSYRDFIDDYWKTFIENARNSKKQSYEDENVIFKSNIKTLAHIISDKTDNLKLLEKDIKSFQDSTLGGNGTRLELIINNSFLKQISNHLTDKYWVDIENEYYEKLKKSNHNEAEVLNKELKIIEKLLEKYLTRIEKKLNNSTIPESLRKNIYSQIDLKDIAEVYEKIIINNIIIEIKNLTNTSSEVLEYWLNSYKIRYNLSSKLEDIKYFFKDFSKKISDDFYFVKKQIEQNKLPDYFLVPNDILFLNFNYTKTTNKYIPENSGFEIIHIHGELNNPKKPIIFGYGDELAEDYKQIENLNDNEYLKNVKSIRYLDTDNYRKMLNFIESKPYQIFIMGHSCGNSDRTLLNTLFEHKNCVSIKPFYHQREDGSDNYNEIVQNISRNFTNKAIMRERVVNKTYCEPLT